MKNRIRRNIFGIIIGTIFVSIMTVYAATKIYANNISIDTTNISELASGATLDTAITKLYEKINSKKCPDGYVCYEKFTPKIGDYVKMIPTIASYGTDKTYTGELYGSDTIFPEELNLWRVIRINDDGTIDMVSEYLSSTKVYFRGKTGYRNFVRYLNVLASKYENSKYTVGSRYMGYNGQTEYLSDTANTLDSTNTTPPWTSSSTAKKYESQGGGDELYKTDTELVTNAIGTLEAKYNFNGNYLSSDSYWLSGRYYAYYSSTTSWTYGGRIVTSSGGTGGYLDLYEYSSGFSTISSSSRLRPIVTLKSDLYVLKAAGTSSDPWVLP